MNTNNNAFRDFFKNLKERPSFFSYYEIKPMTLKEKAALAAPIAVGVVTIAAGIAIDVLANRNN